MNDVTLVCLGWNYLEFTEIDKLFDDDWNSLEGGFDEYVWGWDGGGFTNYDR